MFFLRHFFAMKWCPTYYKMAPDKLDNGAQLRLPDVFECQGVSLNLLSKHVMSLILEKMCCFLEYFPTSLKVLEQL